MRFLVWDDYNEKLIGLLALGDPVFNLRVRDEWIGWTVKQREERLVNVLDAYVLGAVPRYNMILGGKLICYMMMSNEVRDLFRRKYCTRLTVTRQRAANELVLLATTSLYGNRSSQYNRIRYEGDLLYKPIDLTRGYGTVHLSSQTFELMRQEVSDRQKVARNRSHGAT
jgi:hypothetical protein